MKLNIKEISLFSLLGALMFVLKILMQSLPNIHLLGVFIVSITVVFRAKALIPIYVYVFLDGLFCAFATWWIAYLYIWTILWALIMILPKNMKQSTALIVYCAVCFAHGLLFGVFYAPTQALFYGLDFYGMIAWVGAGFVYDVIHAVSNLLCTALLFTPLVALLNRAKKQIS